MGTQTKGFTISMDNSYVAPVIESSTTTTTTAKPTVSTTKAASTTTEASETTEQIVKIKEADNPPNQQAINANGAFHVSWMIWTISACVLCWGFFCIIFYLRKQRKQRKHV